MPGAEMTGVEIDGLYDGDTAPLELTFKQAGVPVDVTGYGFKLKIGYATGTVTKNAAIVTPQASNLGKFRFPFAAGDLKAGNWPAQFVITYPDTTEKTQPIVDGLTINKRL